MSTSIFNAKAAGMRTKNTALTNAFTPDGTRCFLLRRAGDTSKFAVVRELTAGYRAKWNGFRGQMSFSYATTETDIADVFARSTHIAYGVPDGSAKLEVYEIAAADDQSGRDIVAPDVSSVYWKAYTSKIRAERFTIPTPPEPEP